MDISALIDKLRSSPDIMLYPAATQQQIQVFEEKVELRLPPDLKSLYSCSNGFEGIEDLFRIVPLEEILDNKERYNNLTANQFDIAEFLIYADVWHIELNSGDDAPYTIFYLTPEEKGEKVPLTNSLGEFINHFLVGGMYGHNGVYDWMKSVAPRLRLFL